MEKHPEYQYLDLLSKILKEGTVKDNRTGVMTKSIFGAQMRFDLAKGFPLLTTKKVFLRGITEELLWFLQGSTNIKYLVDRDVKIWNEWAFDNYLDSVGLKDKFERYSDEWNAQLQDFVQKIKDDAEFAAQYGDLGPVYGKQWRCWEDSNGLCIDQISNLIYELKTNPNSRRLIVAAWNVVDLPKMALSPCHCFIQFYVADGKLSAQMYQRSADMFLGVPFNIASYALLTMMVAHVCDLELGEFVHTLGDAHIYENHFEQVEQQLAREPRAWPKMKLDPEQKDIFGFKIEDFELSEYDPHPAIKGAVAV